MAKRFVISIIKSAVKELIKIPANKWFEDTYFEEVRDHYNLLLSIDPEFIAKNVSVRDIEKLMRCFDIAEYQDGQLHVRFRRTWSPRLGRYVTHGTRERLRDPSLRSAKMENFRRSAGSCTTKKIHQKT